METKTKLGKLPKKSPENKETVTPTGIPKKEKAYWKSKIYIRGIGTVSGVATPDQIEAFNRAAIMSDSTAEDYLINYDPVQALQEARVKKMKSRIGLKD